MLDPVEASTASCPTPLAFDPLFALCSSLSFDKCRHTPTRPYRPQTPVPLESAPPLVRSPWQVLIQNHCSGVFSGRSHTWNHTPGGPWGLASFAQQNAVAVVLWASEAHPFSCCVLSVVRVPYHLFIGHLVDIFMTSRF